MKEPSCQNSKSKKNTNNNVLEKINLTFLQLLNATLGKKDQIRSQNLV